MQVACAFGVLGLREGFNKLVEEDKSFDCISFDFISFIQEQTEFRFNTVYSIESTCRFDRYFFQRFPINKLPYI